MSALTLSDLERRYSLTRRSGAALATLLGRLSDPGAPTAVHASAEAINVHIADSLAGLELAVIRDAKVISDLGAGAGLPGLVLAAVLPRAHVMLVESAAKKCRFMRAAIEAMDVRNVDVVQARAEEWTAGQGRCDVVCARALAALPVLCEYAAPLLRAGGTLVAWKGAVDDAEAADGRAAAAQLGLSDATVMPVIPYPGSEQRTFHLFRKIAPTPPRFPRRPGIAAKRPLFATKLR